MILCRIGLQKCARPTWAPMTGVPGADFDLAALAARLFCLRARVLTIEYSMNAPNTKTRHVAIHTSIAFVNDPAGMLRSNPEL